jgi:hypothetical protein
MKQIPVKIVEYTISGETRKNVMIDLIDTYEISGNVENKIKKFKKKYFDLIKKSEEIFPKEKSKRKPSHFWQMGKLLYDFNKSIEKEFKITNYQQAVIRDFSLYNRSVVGHVIQFGEFFNKKDIVDTISMSHYMELIWKSSLLQKMKKLEGEKKRLIKRANEKTLPPHKEYREELNELVESKSGGK